MLRSTCNFVSYHFFITIKMVMLNILLKLLICLKNEDTNHMISQFVSQTSSMVHRWFESLPFARFNVRMFLGLYPWFMHGLTHCHQCSLMYISLLTKLTIATIRHNKEYCIQKNYGSNLVNIEFQRVQWVQVYRSTNNECVQNSNAA